MSRCFPFPPPGYERKHTPEDLDSLKEAKRKEKKHKKEKKDKERKKDKEKKEKDASVEKHKDKKDRKEKHKDKKEKHRDKKDREERVKDKEKSSISEESAVAGKLEDKTGGTEVPSNDRSSSLSEGKCFAQFQGQNGVKPSQSTLPSLVNDESKFVQELNRRIRDEEKDSLSQLPEEVAVRNSSGPLAEEKVDNRNKIIQRKLDRQGHRNEYSGNMMGPLNRMPMVKSRGEAIHKPVDEQNGRRLEDGENYKETGGGRLGGKQKERDKESQAKEKDKEKKKEGKAKKKNENNKSSLNQLKDDVRNDLCVFTGINQSANLLKDTNNNAANEANIRKRKDALTNGFRRETEIRPNKISRLAPHPLTENGRKLEPSRTPTEPSQDKHAVLNSVHVDSKDRLTNGLIEAHTPSALKPKGEASKVPYHENHHTKKPLKLLKTEDPIAEASRRPTHPDSKYLVEVLTVPKMEDWLEDDDQGWLFDEKGSSSKPSVGPIGVDEGPHVWSEAVHIESADVCALPYVIPY